MSAKPARCKRIDYSSATIAGRVSALADAVADMEASIRRVRELRATRYQAQADDLFGDDREEARIALRGY